MVVYKLESCSLFGRDYTHRFPKPLKDEWVTIVSQEISSRGHGAYRPAALTRTCAIYSFTPMKLCC